jgi:Protein of unknown function (DUF3551)
MRRLLSASLFVSLSATVGSPTYAERYCLQGQHWGYPGNCHFSSYRPMRGFRVWHKCLVRY